MSRASRPSTNLSTSSIRDCGLPPPPTTTIRSWTPSCPPMWRPRGSQARPQIAPRVPRFRRLCRVCRARAMHRRGALFPLHLCRSQGPAKAQIIDRGEVWRPCADARLAAAARIRVANARTTGPAALRRSRQADRPSSSSIPCSSPPTTTATATSSSSRTKSRCTAPRDAAAARGAAHRSACEANREGFGYPHRAQTGSS